MKLGIRHLFGSFKVLRQRARDERLPGMAVWADVGEKAATAVCREVRDGAHVVECQALELERDLRAMLADGKIDDVELARLRLAPARIHGVAERAHDLGEVVS